MNIFPVGAVYLARGSTPDASYAAPFFWVIKKEMVEAVMKERGRLLSS